MSKDTFSLDFSPAELALLLSLFQAPGMLGLKDPFPGMLADEIEAQLSEAKQSLQARDYIRVSVDGGVTIDRTVAGLVAACAFPEYTLVATYEHSKGRRDTCYIHFRENLIVEDAVMDSGQHQLTALRDREVALKRLLRQLRLSKQVAAPGRACIVSESLLFEARGAAVDEGVAKAIPLLTSGGVDADAAAHIADTLSHPVSNSAMALIKFGDRQKQSVEGFALLEGKNGLWSLRSVSKGSREPLVEIAPCDASEAIRQVVELVSASIKVSATS